MRNSVTLCEACDKPFTTRRGLAQHELTAHGLPTYHGPPPRRPLGPPPDRATNAPTERRDRREPWICPYCRRIMSNREHDEQGACNDCYKGCQDVEYG